MARAQRVHGITSEPSPMSEPEEPIETQEPEELKESEPAPITPESESPMEPLPQRPEPEPIEEEYKETPETPSEPDPDVPPSSTEKTASTIVKAAIATGARPGVMGRFRSKSRAGMGKPKRIAATWGSLIKRTDSALESLEKARGNLSLSLEKDPESEEAQALRDRVTRFEDQLDKLMQMQSKIGQFWERE